MKKEKQFLAKGLFEKRFMNSRIKTASMTWKEKILGYTIGPFGTLALIAIVNQLGELYYTEIFYIDQIFGVGTYMAMAWISQVVGIIMGLVIAYIVERTVSSQGRMRPYILIGSLVLAVAGLCKFWIPNMPNVAKLVWVYFFNFLYTGVGMVMFNLKFNLQTLCTRNYTDRMQVNLAVQICAYMLIGVAINLIVGSVLYYTMLHDFPAENWIMLVAVISVISIPLAFVHYYYTKERLTLEERELKEKRAEEEVSESTKENQPPKLTFWQQIKAFFKCKFWVMAFLIGIVNGISQNLVGANLSTNFCTVILGATAENNYNLIYTIASGVPLGLGILLIYPVSKKFTIRKTTIFFGIIAILGCVMGLFVGNKNFILVVVANFLYNFGTLPLVYTLSTLTQSANDELEYKYDFRPEGVLSGSLIAAFSGIITGAFAGLYETGLTSNGYDAALGTAQPDGVYSWLYFVRYGVPIIQFTLLIGILIFMTLEKHLPKMNEEIRARRKAEAEARGEVYISPEERAEQERIEDERLSELARIEDLKTKCAKKGLDFETENAKYLAIQEEKHRRWEEKQAKKQAKKKKD